MIVRLPLSDGAGLLSFIFSVLLFLSSFLYRLLFFSVVVCSFFLVLLHSSYFTIVIQLLGPFHGAIAVPNIFQMLLVFNFSDGKYAVDEQIKLVLVS